MRSRMRESASTDLREPQGSNPLGPPGPELPVSPELPGATPTSRRDALMPLDAQAQDFLRRLAAANLPSFEEQTVAQLRAQMNMSTHFLGELPRVAHVEDRRIPGPGGTLRVRIITPQAAGNGLLPVLVYFHGVDGYWEISNRTRGSAGRWPMPAE